MDHLKNSEEGYKKAYLREKAIREKAESLLEDKSRDLFLANEELQKNFDALKSTTEALHSTQAQLIHQEKMVSIGQLAAGVAHEINNPLAFVISNVNSIKEYVAVFKQLLDEYHKIGKNITEDTDHPQYEDMIKIKKVEDDEDLNFISEDLESLFIETTTGAERVKNIVADLRKFSNIDQADICQANINDCIDQAINITADEVSKTCKIEKNLGDIPSIQCYPGELNQVFMHLLTNAAQATEEQGTITIQSSDDEKNINITVSDTGKGIPEEKLVDLFNPFFTMNDVGGGMGLGLATVYAIIQNHQGKIDVESQLGTGTSFSISIPKQGLSDTLNTNDEVAS